MPENISGVPAGEKCFSLDIPFYRTSGQLPEPPSGVGRCSTADRSDAGPHAPITAGLAIIQDKVEARIIQRRWPGLANGGRAEP
jgi:hypothetical protein